MEPLHPGHRAADPMAHDAAVRFQPLVNFAREHRLNVLFLMSDQHQAAAMGCAGHPTVQTPHLDRLAREGTRFSQAFCHTPQCCPSRMTIWTGRYTHNHGLYFNGVPDPHDQPMVAKSFAAAGYATATIGKHHMQSPLGWFGFDTNIDMNHYEAWRKAEGIADYREEGDWHPFKIYEPVGRSHVPNEQQPSGYFTREMIRYLQRHQQDPFCAWYSLIAPHTPLTPPDPWATMYDPEQVELPANVTQTLSHTHKRYPILEKKIRAFGSFTPEQHRQALATYYGMVTQVDHNIGEVLAELDRLGLAERTLVIYTSDHGELGGAYAYWTKSCLCYDALMKVPLIMRLPGVIQAGQVREELVGLVDLLPTFCELAGVEPPDTLDGMSLAPLLRGENPAWRATVFAEIGHPERTPLAEGGRCRAARSATAKYIHNENGGDPFEEFYDLQTDPWEMRNQIEDPAFGEQIEALRTELVAWQSGPQAPVYPVAAGAVWIDA